MVSTYFMDFLVFLDLGTSASASSVAPGSASSSLSSLTMRLRPLVLAAVLVGMVVVEVVAGAVATLVGSPKSCSSLFMRRMMRMLLRRSSVPRWTVENLMHSRRSLLETHELANLLHRGLVLGKLNHGEKQLDFLGLVGLLAAGHDELIGYGMVCAGMCKTGTLMLGDGGGLRLGK